MSSDSPIIASQISTRPLSELMATPGQDLSCRDFVDQVVEGKNFFEVIFNGCVFSRARARQSIFQHAEFTEATFSECTFEDSSFDHSDFVLATVKDARFIRCSFQNAEWRDSLFERVQFEQCIFRNTTTSLAEFVDCAFDKPSASSFVGNSKRFSLFSGTSFCLPEAQLDFLKTNFGITSETPFPKQPIRVDDPLFQLAVDNYSGSLTSDRCANSILTALSQLEDEIDVPQRLRLRYIAGICRALMRDRFFSVFALEYLERHISNRARLVRSTEQALHLFNLILSLRVEMRSQIREIEAELSQVTTAATSRLILHMEFARTFDRAAIKQFSTLLAEFCNIPNSHVTITAFEQGSTIAEVAVQATISLIQVFRFLRYSLSKAAVAIEEAKRVGRAASKLKAGMSGRTRGEDPRSAKKAAPRKHKETPSESIANEISGARLREAVQSRCS